MALVARRLVDEGRLPPLGIHLAIERQMKCALGTCGRCYVGSRYACRDGPVFSLAELATLDPAFRTDERRSM
jgi:sulfhydrogenase subunit gamma (sulfur reductase)